MSAVSYHLAQLRAEYSVSTKHFLTLPSNGTCHPHLSQIVGYKPLVLKINIMILSKATSF